VEITNICRYPIKGLQGECCDSVDLKPGCGIAHDREYAITHANSNANTVCPAWMHRRNYVAIARSPQIYSLSLSREPPKSADTGSLQVSLNGETCFETSHSAEPLAIESPAFSQLLEPTQRGPHQLIKTSGYSLWDAPFASISLLNLASLEALSKELGQPIEHSRFRGNIWFRGTSAWQELDWVGKKLHVQSMPGADDAESANSISFRVIDRIERCRVINTNPETGQLDYTITRHLLDTRGHADFGVHLEVLNDGVLAVGDQLDTK